MTRLKYTKQVGLILVFLGILVTVSYLAQFFLQERAMITTRNQLMTNPLPTPSYIFGIAPFPGTEFPTDAAGDYRTRDENEIICVGIDANIINSQLRNNTNLHPLEVVPGDSVDLYLNGKLHYKVNKWQDTDGNFISPQSMYTFYPSGGNKVTPVDFCWVLILPSGTHLAKIHIHSEISGTLSYQWAFEVAEN